MSKKITVSFLIILICSIAFINGYTYVYPSYADSTTDQWESVTTNQELVTAFRYYCKSRNLAIEGSAADALTSFTTDRFDQICNTLGIDVTALQAHLKRSTDGSGKLQFLFDQFGVTAYNRIFAEFLQNNDIEVGEQVDDKVVYDGSIFIDDDGNKCLVFYLNYNYTTRRSGNISEILKYGSSLKYSTQDLYNLCPLDSSYNLTFNIFETTYSGNATTYGNTTNGLGYFRKVYSGKFNDNNVLTTYDGYNVFSSSSGSIVGYPTIVHWKDNKYSIGTIGLNTGGSSVNNQAYLFKGLLISTQAIPDHVNPANIYVTTNNQTINNNNYENNSQTVINNQGDVYNYDYDDDDPPVNPPSGGGGGGTVTPPSDSGGTDGDITFPNFDFQLPEINWSIGDVTEKFPFSIPFDLISFFTVLNAEPRAPAIDANIPLGSWYTWHFQADFSQFDNWATIIRNVEFIAFCIGLIYLTIRLIKG